jgi:hypothetical protein
VKAPPRAAAALSNDSVLLAEAIDVSFLVLITLNAALAYSIAGALRHERTNHDRTPRHESKASSGATRSGRLFVLELSGDRIHSMNIDGSDRKTIVTDCHLPDGLVEDAQADHIYWTNMGVPNLDDGSIERVDLDGGNRRVVVPQGITHTPKQIHLDKDSSKLYWCDREGMRVMRPRKRRFLRVVQYR